QRLEELLQKLRTLVPQIADEYQSADTMSRVGTVGHGLARSTAALADMGVDALALSGEGQGLTRFYKVAREVVGLLGSNDLTTQKIAGSAVSAIGEGFDIGTLRGEGEILKSSDGILRALEGEPSSETGILNLRVIKAALDFANEKIGSLTASAVL